MESNFLIIVDLCALREGDNALEELKNNWLVFNLALRLNNYSLFRGLSFLYNLFCLHESPIQSFYSFQDSNIYPNFHLDEPELSG